MNIYLLTLKSHSYDEYDAWVVVSNNEDEVLKLCNIADTPEKAKDSWYQNQYKNNVESIKLIGTSNSYKIPQIIMGSFNAG